MQLQGSEKPVLKKSQPTVFWILLGFGPALLSFRMFLFQQQLENLLADLAHQLSFYL